MKKDEIKFVSFQVSKEKIFYVYSNEDLTSIDSGFIKISKDLVDKLPHSLPDYLTSCKDEINNLLEGIKLPIVSIKPLEAGGITLKEAMVFRAMVEGVLIQFLYEKTYTTYRFKSQTIKKALNYKISPKEISKINDIPDFPDWWASFPQTYRELALYLIATQRLHNDD